MKIDYEIDKIFKFSDQDPLDKNIWNNLVNDLTDRSHPRIKLSELNDIDHQECRRLIEYSADLVAAQFERTISLNKIRKTATGYNLQYTCKKYRLCHSCWSVKINVENNEVYVQSKRVCNHLTMLSDKPSKFLFFYLHETLNFS